MVAKFTLLTLLLTKFPRQRNLICQETRRSAAAACSADSYDRNAWPVKLATHYDHTAWPVKLATHYDHIQNGG